MDRRTIGLVLAGVVGAHLLLGFLLFDPKPFIGGDNAAYMALAESLESGSGYRDVYLPGAPRHAQYPPFYPFLLALIRAAGGALIAFKLLSLFLTAGAVVLLFVLARTRLDAMGALAITVPFALSPLLLYYSHWVLSEAPFVLLTLLALWAVTRPERSWTWLALTAVAAALAYLTRAAGLPLLLAVLVPLAWRREWRHLAAVGTPLALVAAGWWSWGRLVSGRGADVYGSNFLLVNPYAPEQGYVGPGDLLIRVVDNMRRYVVEVLPATLAGRDPAPGIELLAILTALLVVLLAIVGWARRVRKGEAIEAFTFLYAGLIFLWPQVWTDQRFLLPLLPIVLIHAAGGLVWCFEFVQRERPLWALPALGAVLTILALPDHARGVSANRRCMQLYRQGDRLACYAPQWRAFVATAEWVRDNTAPDAVVVTRKPRLFYYFSGRRGDVYPFTADEATVLGFLDEIEADYVVVAGLSGTTYRYLVPVIQGAPERFEPVHRIVDRSAPAYVLRYIREPRTGAGDSAEERAR